MGMKLKMYELLVNRKRLIKNKYEAYCMTCTDGGGKAKIKKAAKLFGLNFRYYILHDRSTAIKKKPEKIKLAVCESEASFREPPEQLAKRLSGYDIVTFDIFDTLIFRRTAYPTDVFYFAGQKLGYPDYKRLRRNAERSARDKKHKSSGSYEVTLSEIAAEVSRITGLTEDRIIKEELEAEKRLCFANPYMKRVWDLVDTKKLILSDMYLSADMLFELLCSCGYTVDRQDIFVSCELMRSKWDGTAYPFIKEKFGSDKRYAHVGDNAVSDVGNSAKNGFTPFSCTDPNKAGNKYRTRDMSDITGALWAGTVNSHFHSGAEKFDMFYEYGFSVGGILIFGYCNFINRIVKEKNIDKVLFLSRDGYIVKKIYDRLFPGSNTEYVYWSRTVGAAAASEYLKSDFTDKYILQKSGKCGIIKNVVAQAGILPAVEKWGIDLSAPFDDGTAKRLADVVLDHFDEVKELFKEEKENTSAYLSDIVKKEDRRVLTVDCGWAGSGHFSVSALLKEIYPDIETFGALCASNNAYHLHRDATDPFFADGSLYSYCFSPFHNRDLYEFHSPQLMHNMLFEMLFSSEEGSAIGFRRDNSGVVPVLSDNPNSKAVARIHKGTEDFCDIFMGIDLPAVKNISGRDAYAPFKCAMSDRKYLSALCKGYTFEENVMKRS